MTNAPFYAVRRLRGGYFEPTLYKRREAAEAYANARRGYDVVALIFAETADKYRDQVRDTCARAERAETPTPQQVASEGSGGLDWLAANRNCELSYRHGDEDDGPGGWQVHRRSGGVNDREWTLIASAETPEAALALATKEQGHD